MINTFYNEAGELCVNMPGGVLDYLDAATQSQYLQRGYIEYPDYGTGEQYDFMYCNSCQVTSHGFHDYNECLDSRYAARYPEEFTRLTGPLYRKYYDHNGIPKASKPDWDDWDSPLYSEYVVQDTLEDAEDIRREALLCADLNVMTSSEIRQWLDETKDYNGYKFQMRKSYALRLANSRELQEAEYAKKRKDKINGIVKSFSQGMSPEERKLFASIVNEGMDRYDAEQEAIRVNKLNEHNRILKSRRYYLKS